MTETLANGYSSESTHWELSNEYQHDRVEMVFKNLCILVIGTKVASALEGLINNCQAPIVALHCCLLVIVIFMHSCYFEISIDCTY